jgi:cytochrome oxidase Cu insertion factor (SCO1/SenC/PrrC family)
MIGLRGTLEEVKTVAKLFRVYFMRTNDTKDYLVDHSIIMVCAFLHARVNGLQGSALQGKK